jgi:hypothetical protein
MLRPSYWRTFSVDVWSLSIMAIPGIRAKPILDLMPVAISLTNLDTRRSDIEALGYER